MPRALVALGSLMSLRPLKSVWRRRKGTRGFRESEGLQKGFSGTMWWKRGGFAQQPDPKVQQIEPVVPDAAKAEPAEPEPAPMHLDRLPKTFRDQSKSLAQMPKSLIQMQIKHFALARQKMVNQPYFGIGGESGIAMGFLEFRWSAVGCFFWWLGAMFMFFSGWLLVHFFQDSVLSLVFFRSLPL